MISNPTSHNFCLFGILPQITFGLIQAECGSVDPLWCEKMVTKTELMIIIKSLIVVLSVYTLNDVNKEIHYIYIELQHLILFLYVAFIQ